MSGSVKSGHYTPPEQQEYGYKQRSDTGVSLEEKLFDVLWTIMEGMKNSRTGGDRVA